MVRDTLQRDTYRRKERKGQKTRKRDGAGAQAGAVTLRRDGLTLLTALVLLATLLLAGLLLAGLLLLRTRLLPTLLLLTGLLLVGLLVGLPLLPALLLILIELHRLAALGVLVFLHLVGHDLRPSLLLAFDAKGVPPSKM